MLQRCNLMLIYLKKDQARDETGNDAPYINENCRDR